MLVTNKKFTNVYEDHKYLVVYRQSKELERAFLFQFIIYPGKYKLGKIKVVFDKLALLLC